MIDDDRWYCYFFFIFSFVILFIVLYVELFNERVLLVLGKKNYRDNLKLKRLIVYNSLIIFGGFKVVRYFSFYVFNKNFEYFNNYIKKWKYYLFVFVFKFYVWLDDFCLVVSKYFDFFFRYGNII